MDKKILYYVSVADDEVGEVEGIFTATMELIHSWNCNDALWRSEYFNPLFEKLGYTVYQSGNAYMEEALKKAWQ